MFGRSNGMQTIRNWFEPTQRRLLMLNRSAAMNRLRHAAPNLDPNALVRPVRPEATVRLVGRSQASTNHC